MKSGQDIYIDGALYCFIALFGFAQAYFSSDEAYKYVSPYTLFWAKCIIGMGAAVAGALKMFRSTTFADHKNGVDKPDAPANPDPPTTKPL